MSPSDGVIHVVTTILLLPAGAAAFFGSRLRQAGAPALLPHRPSSDNPILWQIDRETVRSAMGSHPLNLAFRFLLELAALIALGIWGWSLSSGATRVVAALVTPLAAAAMWGLFNVPDDPSRSGAAPIPVRGVARLAGELAFFALAAWALAASGHASLGIALAVAVAIHYAISYDRIAWLIAR